MTDLKLYKNNFCNLKRFLADSATFIRHCELTKNSPMSEEKFSEASWSKADELRQSRVSSDFERLSSTLRGSRSKQRSQLVSGCNQLNAFNKSEGPVRSCCCNYCYMGSSLSTAIRQPLSAPSLNFRKTFCFTNVRKTIIFLMVFLFSMRLPHVESISSYNTPLVKTDATQDESFKIFNGKGSQTDEILSLDFQKLKIIPQWEDLTDVLLLSGRNYVFMINASTVTNNPEILYMKRLKWTSEQNLRFNCWHMGKSKFECNNFIRVMEVQEDNKLYICGTNSYAPKCRYYSKESFNAPNDSADSEFLTNSECDRHCPCPYNPTKSSVSLYANTSIGSQLFSASIDNFMANMPVLMKKSNQPIYSFNKWFNDPTFIKLIEAKNGKVYLFFRETAKGVETGKDSTTYGRVAQVCKNDKGGTSVLLHQRWTSFLKARLKCSISDSDYEADLSFDNLTSVSDITTVAGPDGRPLDVVFATFTTPWSWKTVAMSTVCAFSLDAIEDLFSTGRFLSEQVLQLESFRNRNPFGSIVKAVAVSEEDVPFPRPGKCLENNVQLSDKSLHFAKEHFLMFDPVLPVLGKPIYVSEQNVRATQIISDNNNETDDALIYVGTEDGKILRIRPNLIQSDELTSIVLEEMAVAPLDKCSVGGISCGILALKIHRSFFANREPSLFVAFTDRMVRVPLHSCVKYSTAECCNVDPACHWVKKSCNPRGNRVRPSTSHLTSVPSNCQKTEACDYDDIMLLAKEICINTFKEDLQGNNNKNFNNRKPHLDFGNQNQLGQSISFRSVQNVNGQPESSSLPITVNQRGCETVTRDENPGSSNSVDKLTLFFIKQVLPSISTEFAETIRALPDADRQGALFQQLRNAMIETTRLVLKNHKMDHCLPNQTVNTLTHSYPLLLREIESWHSLALKKMEPDKRWACWENVSSDCTARVSFSALFAPTLWGPLTNLIEEFGGSCDSIPTEPDQTENGEGCHLIPGTLPCRDEKMRNSRFCQVRKCRFSKYAVDVKAFFRHVNDSRNFLSAENGNEPFRKPAIRIPPLRRALRSHFELSVNSAKPFQIFYYPNTEKVKIMFFYSQVPDCVTTENGCSENGDGCNEDLEEKLNEWFTNFMSRLAMSSSSRLCSKQIKKALIEDRENANRLVRRGRSTSDNRPPRSEYKRCLYVKKTYNFHSKLWIPLVERARSSGAFYSDQHSKLAFNIKSDVIRFFEHRCPDGPNWPTDLRSMKSQRARRSRSNNAVEVLVSKSMPFVIERIKPSRLRIKFFTINTT